MMEREGGKGRHRRVTPFSSLFVAAASLRRSRAQAHRVARERSDDERYHRRERVESTVCRTMSLPRGISYEGITSRLENGVLHVRSEAAAAAAASRRSVDALPAQTLTIDSLASPHAARFACAAAADQHLKERRDERDDDAPAHRRRVRRAAGLAEEGWQGWLARPGAGGRLRTGPRLESPSPTEAGGQREKQTVGAFQ